MFNGRRQRRRPIEQRHRLRPGDCRPGHRHRRHLCDSSNAFLSNDPAPEEQPRHRSRRATAGRAPWSNQLDLRYAVTLPTGGHTSVDFTMDILNFLNLLNKNWGWQYFPLFPASGGGLIGYARDRHGDRARKSLDLSTITSQRSRARSRATTCGRGGRRSGDSACGSREDQVSGRARPARRRQSRRAISLRAYLSFLLGRLRLYDSR